MQIDKEKFTIVALGYVEQGKEYSKEEVILETATEIMQELNEKLGWCFGTEDLSILRAVFRTAARANINWSRINRKVNPEEYADEMWRVREEAPLKGGWNE